MCSGSEAGWYLRLIDFVYHSTLGLRVIKKKEENLELVPDGPEVGVRRADRHLAWIKSPFSRPCFVLALAGSRRRVIQIKAFEE